MSCYVADRDHCTWADYAADKERLECFGLAAIFYSSYSNTPPDDVRYRVVIPFAEPVRAGQWEDVWQRGNACLFDGGNDRQTKDLSRMFYLPTASPDVAVFAEVLDGAALDVDALPAAPRAAVSVPSDSPADHRGSIAHVGYRALTFVANGASVGRQRGEALATTRNYLAAGYSVEDTITAVWRGLQVSPCGDPASPWAEADARAIVKDLACGAAPPLQAWPDMVADDTPAANGQGKAISTATGASDRGGYARPVTREVPWPAPLADEAFHGLAGRVVQAIAPHSEADPAALLGHFHSGIGALMHLHVHAVAGDACQCVVEMAYEEARNEHELAQQEHDELSGRLREVLDRGDFTAMAGLRPQMDRAAGELRAAELRVQLAENRLFGRAEAVREREEEEGLHV